MILNMPGESITAYEKTLAVGGRVRATDSVYAGLKGTITEIRTDADKDTENVTDDVYCDFDVPETEAEIRMLEDYFSALFGTKKTIDNLCLDSVIMAPEELDVIEEV